MSLKQFQGLLLATSLATLLLPGCNFEGFGPLPGDDRLLGSGEPDLSEEPWQDDDDDFSGDDELRISLKHYRTRMNRYSFGGGATIFAFPVPDADELHETGGYRAEIVSSGAAGFDRDSEARDNLRELHGYVFYFRHYPGIEIVSIAKELTIRGVSIRLEQDQKRYKIPAVRSKPMVFTTRLHFFAVGKKKRKRRRKKRRGND